MELVLNIAEAIIKKHLELAKQQLGSLEIAISIGEMLNEKKENLNHGEFTPWIQENLPFSLRTAQKYLKVFYKREEFHQLGANGLTDAYLLISPVQEADTDVHIHKNPTRDSDGEIDVTPIETNTESHGQISAYDYWDHLGPLIEKMESVHARLIGLRNSTTPESLGHMFGNIKDMVEVLKTWDPESMEPCPMCNGDGCPVCVNGKIGSYKESEF